MIRKKQGSIEWLEFELLADEPNLVHGVFLRHGGVSEGPYGSLNVARATNGDLDKNVQENRKRIQHCFQLDRLITTYHVHDTHVEWVKEAKEQYPDCDGLMTTEQNWGLLATHADCQATLFYDPINQAIAAVHAGWRGQVKGIYSKTVEVMGQRFGSKPANLLVCISPSLGPSNSEFKNFKTELPESFWTFQIKPTYFDLWAIARDQLEKSGILPHHIQIASIDTYAHPADFFSYRRGKAEGRQEKITGGHGTVIALL